jgi:hypothetical protein
LGPSYCDPFDFSGCTGVAVDCIAAKAIGVVERCDLGKEQSGDWVSVHEFRTLAELVSAGVKVRRRKILPWFSTRKSGLGVGELADDANESLCEDIIPPVWNDAVESLGED